MSQVNIDPYKNASLMASKIAITYMRDTSADKKQMGCSGVISS